MLTAIAGLSFKAKLFTAYAALSGLLFVYPNLLHQRKTHANQQLSQAASGVKILRVSHRGGSRQRIQNTLQAFQQVDSLCDCFELDICETKDNILVIHHDLDLQRTCGCPGLVSSYNKDDLPEFNPRVRQDFAVNQWTTSRGQRIPTLEQLFQAFPGKLMNIELKNPTPTAQAELARLIRKYRRQDDTIVGINNAQLYKFKSSHPTLLTYFNHIDMAKTILAYSVGLLPFLPITDIAYQIPIYSREYMEWKLSITPPQQQWKIKAAHMLFRVMYWTTIPLIWHLKRRGIVTMGWVCNTPQAMGRAHSMGLQAIMSDEPARLHSFLNQSQQ